MAQTNKDIMALVALCLMLLFYQARGTLDDGWDTEKTYISKDDEASTYRLPIYSDKRLPHYSPLAKVIPLKDSLDVLKNIPIFRNVPYIKNIPTMEYIHVPNKDPSHLSHITVLKDIPIVHHVPVLDHVSIIEKVPITVLSNYGGHSKSTITSYLDHKDTYITDDKKITSIEGKLTYDDEDDTSVGDIHDDNVHDITSAIKIKKLHFHGKNENVGHGDLLTAEPESQIESIVDFEQNDGHFRLNLNSGHGVTSLDEDIEHILPEVHKKSTASTRSYKHDVIPITQKKYFTGFSPILNKKNCGKGWIPITKSGHRIYEPIASISLSDDDYDDDDDGDGHIFHLSHKNYEKLPLQHTDSNRLIGTFHEIKNPGYNFRHDHSQYTLPEKHRFLSAYHHHHHHISAHDERLLDSYPHGHYEEEEIDEHDDHSLHEDQDEHLTSKHENEHSDEDNGDQIIQEDEGHLSHENNNKGFLEEHKNGYLVDNIDHHLPKSEPKHLIHEHLDTYLSEKHKNSHLIDSHHHHHLYGKHKESYLTDDHESDHLNQKINDRYSISDHSVEHVIHDQHHLNHKHHNVDINLEHDAKIHAQFGKGKIADHGDQNLEHAKYEHKIHGGDQSQAFLDGEYHKPTGKRDSAHQTSQHQHYDEQKLFSNEGGNQLNKGHRQQNNNGQFYKGPNDNYEQKPDSSPKQRYPDNAERKGPSTANKGRILHWYFRKYHDKRYMAKEQVPKEGTIQASQTYGPNLEKYGRPQFSAGLNDRTSGYGERITSDKKQLVSSDRKYEKMSQQYKLDTETNPKYDTKLDLSSFDTPQYPPETQYPEYNNNPSDRQATQNGKYSNNRETTKPPPGGVQSQYFRKYHQGVGSLIYGGEYPTQRNRDGQSSKNYQIRPQLSSQGGGSQFFISQSPQAKYSPHPERTNVDGYSQKSSNGYGSVKEGNQQPISSYYNIDRSKDVQIHPSRYRPNGQFVPVISAPRGYDKHRSQQSNNGDIRGIQENYFRKYHRGLKPPIDGAHTKSTTNEDEIRPYHPKFPDRSASKNLGGVAKMVYAITQQKEYDEDPGDLSFSNGYSSKTEYKKDKHQSTYARGDSHNGNFQDDYKLKHQSQDSRPTSLSVQEKNEDDFASDEYGSNGASQNRGLKSNYFRKYHQGLGAPIHGGNYSETGRLRTMMRRSEKKA